MWKECIKGYSISSLGEVRNDITGRMLKHSLNSGGFHRITIKNKHYAVHRLLAIAFVPNPLGLPNVILKDSNKENITINNTEWSIKQYANALLNAKRELRGNIKLTQGTVHSILFNKNMPAKTLAKMYNISASTVYAIRYGRNMKRLLIGE